MTHEHVYERRGRLNRVTGAVAMLYMARTEHLQADESIHCEEVADADAVTAPWAILAWIRSVPGDDPAWRLVGTYASETAALTARRRLSRRLRSATSAPAA